MTRVYCHECQHEEEVSSSVGTPERCSACNSDFLEVLTSSRETPQHQQSSAPVGSHRAPVASQDTQMSQSQPSQNIGAMDGSDTTVNTTHHTTRFTMPNGHSYEVNFTTHVLPPGMDFSPGIHPAGMPTGLNGDGPHAFMVLGAGGAAGPSADMLATLFGDMAGPGRSRFSSADFGMGQTLESLLTQLAELHQTQEQPTTASFREQLPRLKVPPPLSQDTHVTSATGADQKQQSEGFASCHPGDTCCVCRNEFVTGNEVVQLPCKHCFDEACIMPWLEMHSTCPVCRRKLPHEESSSAASASQAEGAMDTAADTAQQSEHLNPHQTRLASRSASRAAEQPASGAGRAQRRVGSNGPQQAGNNSTDGNQNIGANVGALIMRQLASHVTDQLGQMGFTVPPDFAQQFQHMGSAPSQVQLRVERSNTVPAVGNRSDAEEQAAAARHARQLERRTIESHVAELRRLQALSNQQEAQSVSADFQHQLSQLRQLSRTLQERLALVDTSYSAGRSQHTRLQIQVRAMRDQVIMLRRDQQQLDGQSGTESPTDPSMLQAAVVRLLAFEDSLATAAGQLHVCRQSRQGLRENQRLIDEHIATFDRAVAQGPYGSRVNDGVPAQQQVQPLTDQPSMPGELASSAHGTGVANSGASNDTENPSLSATRPASSPAEGDGCNDHGGRRVRARTDQGYNSSEQRSAVPTRVTFVVGQLPSNAAAPATSQHPQTAGNYVSARPLGDTTDTAQLAPTPALESSSAAMATEDETLPGDNSRQRTPGIGFTLPLHVVPGAFGRLFGGLRGIFGRRT